MASISAGSSVNCRNCTHSGVPSPCIQTSSDGSCPRCTLIDSIELILRSYRHTMRLHRGQEPSDGVWMQGLGTPLWVQVRQVPDADARIEALGRTYRAYN